MSNREYPNILFLMTDEHRPDLAGFAGNSIVRTPNLDRLAKDSVVFNQCLHTISCLYSSPSVYHQRTVPTDLRLRSFWRGPASVLPDICQDFQ